MIYFRSRLRVLEAQLEKNVRQAVATSAIIMQREIKLTLSKSKSPSTPGTPPGVQTGHLRRSVQIDLSGLGNRNPQARIGPNTPYARIHELGGTIAPVNVKYLPVPIGEKGRAARRAAGATLRALKDLIFIRRKGKDPLLARKTKDGIEPLFVLKKAVKMPKRPYVKPAAKAASKRIRAQFSAKRLLRGIP